MPGRTISIRRNERSAVVIAKLDVRGGGRVGARSVRVAGEMPFRTMQIHRSSCILYPSRNSVAAIAKRGLHDLWVFDQAVPRAARRLYFDHRAVGLRGPRYRGSAKAWLGVFWPFRRSRRV